MMMMMVMMMMIEVFILFATIKLGLLLTVHRPLQFLLFEHVSGRQHPVEFIHVWYEGQQFMEKWADSVCRQ